MNKFLLAFALLTGIGMQLQAQTITISGDGIAVPVLITKSMLSEQRQAVVMAKAHDEKVHRYSGVPVANLLAKAGLLLGDTAKRATIKTYVIITAVDNYKVIFALPEIDPLFANRTVILADRADKKALPAEDGPFQIIVPGEKKHARWIRQVTSIQVVKLNI